MKSNSTELKLANPVSNLKGTKGRAFRIDSCKSKSNRFRDREFNSTLSAFHVI